MPVVSGEGDGGEFGVADRDAFGVFGRVVVGLDGEPGFGGGGGDELDDGAHGGEGPASPVESDEAEHAVFDLVPFRGAGRVVAYGDGQAGFGGQSRRGGPSTLGCGIRWSRRRQR